MALLVVRRRPDETLAVRVHECVHGAVEAACCKCFRLASARAEAGAPEQPLGLSRSECSRISGDQRRRPSLMSSGSGSPLMSPKSGKGPEKRGPSVPCCRAEALRLAHTEPAD